MENKNKVLLLIFILLIGFILIYVIKINQQDNTFRYNGYNVIKTAPTVYNIEIFLKNDPNPHYISIRYDPRSLDYIEIEENIKERVLRDNLFITLTPNLTSQSVIAAAEISKIVGNQFLFNIPVNTALTQSKNKDIQVKTCSDVTVKSSVIMLSLGDETKAYKKSECIIVEGTTEEEIIRASTKLVLDILNIAKR